LSVGLKKKGAPDNGKYETVVATVNVLDIRRIAWFFRIMSICHFSTFHFSVEFCPILAMAETRQYNFATSKSLALRFAKNAPCVRGNMQT